MTEDKRQNEIIRIQKKRGSFVLLDKGFLEDSRLSYKAKGILAYLLSKPDNWKVVVKDLITHSQDGKKAIYSGLKELKDCGYYKKIPVRDESGRRISHWESVIFEECQTPEVQDEDSLFPQKGEVDKGTVKSASYVFPPFEEIQNEDIQKGERNNNYINNNYTSNKKSKSRQSQTGQMTETDDYEPTQRGGSVIEKEPPNPRSQSNGLETPPKSGTTIKDDYAKNKKIILTDDYTEYKKIIKSNICYDELIQVYPHHQSTVNELVNAILDVICTEGETVKINGEKKLRSMVMSAYLELNYTDIEHILDQFKNQRHKITHLHSYLKTMLYTVRQEHSHYYDNTVRADGLI